MLLCCDTNHEGNIDYGEFTGRFLDPAKEIGFNLAVLLTNLSEHMPNDPRLAKFLESAGVVLNFFEAFLGRIEIKTADKIERVYFEIDENNIEQWEKPQIKESKRAFFYATITEGGDKEKLECFVDFCEDAIFEMQHAESLMSSEEGSSAKAVSSAPSLPDEDAPRGVIQPLKENVAKGVELLKLYLSYLSPANIIQAVAKAKTMSKVELLMTLLSTAFWMIYGFGYGILKVSFGVGRLLLYLMRGEMIYGSAKKASSAENEELQQKKTAKPSAVQMEIEPAEDKKEPQEAESMAVARVETVQDAAKKDVVDLAEKQAAVMSAVESMMTSKSAKTESSAMSNIDIGAYTRKIVSFLARKFFTMKFIALAIAFLINFMLLCYKVSAVEDGAGQSEDEQLNDMLAEDENGEGEDGEEIDPDEHVHVDERFYYLEYVIRALGITHAFVSLCMLIAYYNLKVPLALFKREKEVARKLEFDGLYLAEQPEDEDIKAHWDKLVISARSFPALYWDKFVKKRVRQKFSEQFEFDAISNILGMEKSAIQQEQEDKSGVIQL